MNEQIQLQATRLAERGLAALGVLVLGWLVLRFLSPPLRRVLERGRLEPLVASFLFTSIRTLLIFVILIVVLQQLGVETASLLTVLGASSVAVALSLQGSLANFASGLILLSFRLVRVGDLIEVGDVRGRVSEMLPFHVVVHTLDNQRVTLPNTLLATSPVRNYSYLPLRRLQWLLPVGGRDDLEACRQALLSCLRADPRILPTPAAEVHVQEWALDHRVLAATAWTSTDQSLDVQQELLEALGKSLASVRVSEPGA
jgi:small conductance mechanosensitive channel